MTGRDWSEGDLGRDRRQEGCGLLHDLADQAVMRGQRTRLAVRLAPGRAGRQAKRIQTPESGEIAQRRGPAACHARHRRQREYELGSHRQGGGDQADPMRQPLLPHAGRADDTIRWGSARLGQHPIRFGQG